MNLRCECGFIETDEERFIDTETHCEDCGSHSAIKCPNCDEVYDHVYSGECCSECGLVLNYGRCEEHPNAGTMDWWNSPLNRGGY